MNVNTTFHDNETVRQQKNLTRAQKKTNSDTKEGVLVNSFIKDGGTASGINLNDTMDTLVISQNTQMPEKLYETDTKSEKSLLAFSVLPSPSVLEISALPPVPNINPTAPSIIRNGIIKFTAANDVLSTKLETKNPSTTP